MRFFRSKTPEENLIIHKNIPLNSRTNTDNHGLYLQVLNEFKVVYYDSTYTTTIKLGK